MPLALALAEVETLRESPRIHHTHHRSVAGLGQPHRHRRPSESAGAMLDGVQDQFVDDQHDRHRFVAIDPYRSFDVCCTSGCTAARVSVPGDSETSATISADDRADTAAVKLSPTHCVSSTGMMYSAPTDTPKGKERSSRNNSGNSARLASLNPELRADSSDTIAVLGNSHGLHR